MKNKFVLICLICCMLIFAVGCSAADRMLATPENLKVDDNGVLHWNSVDGASSYLIFIDGDEQSKAVYMNECDLTDFNLVVGQTYQISVKASGDGTFHLRSKASEPITYVAVAKAPDDNSEEAQNPPTVTQQVTDVNLAKELYESGLGYGVNALTAEKAVGGVRSAAFFDDSLFTVDNVGSYDIGSSRSKATSKESIKEEAASINSRLVYGSSASVSVLSGLFTAGFENKFSLSDAVSSQKHVHQYYFIMNHYIVGKNYQIKNYQQPKAYNDKLSEYAKSDLESVRAGTLTAEKFFERYGTHLAMAVSYGGMTEVYYSTYSQNEINSSEISTNLEMKLNAGMSYNGIGASASSGFEKGLDTKYCVSDSTRFTKLYIESIGKTPMTSLTFDSFAQSYPNWVEKMGNEENYRIVDVADKGLVPIWDYFPDEYADVATTLSQYFEQEATRRGNALADKMTPPQTVPAQTVTLDLIPKNCKDNNQFNTSDQWDDEVAKNEINKTLFQLVMNGTAQNGGKYQIVGDFTLGIKLLQDTENIGVNHINGSAAYNASLSDDTYNGTVKNTTIKGRIGKGAVYINVTYGDGTTEQGYALDICKDKNKNSYIDVLNLTNVRINSSKKLRSIEIVTVYEIAAWWSGFLGITSSTITNWRTDNILYFE